MPRNKEATKERTLRTLYCKVKQEVNQYSYKFDDVIEELYKSFIVGANIALNIYKKRK